MAITDYEPSLIPLVLNSTSVAPSARPSCRLSVESPAAHVLTPGRAAQAEELRRRLEASESEAARKVRSRPGPASAHRSTAVASIHAMALATSLVRIAFLAYDSAGSGVACAVPRPASVQCGWCMRVSG